MTPIDFLTARRSASSLSAPGPSAEQLQQILRAAGSVPDHGLLRPFRFVVVEGDGREAFGKALAGAAAEFRPGMPQGALEKMHSKAFRSPTVICVIASIKPGKIEPWEQKVTAACAGYAIVLGAAAIGVGAVWKSTPFTKGAALAETLGLTDSEEMLGFIHLGTATSDEPLPQRPPLDLAQLASVLDGSGRRPF